MSPKRTACDKISVLIILAVLVVSNIRSSVIVTDNNVITDLDIAFLNNNDTKKLILVKKNSYYDEKNQTTRTNKSISANNHQSKPLIMTSHKKKPNLYIHLGPMKTGSTHLQNNVFTRHYDALQQDNITYIGKHNQKLSGEPHAFQDLVRPLLQLGIFDWYRDPPSPKTQKGREQFKDSLRTIANQGHHVLLSSEELSTLSAWDLGLQAELLANMALGIFDSIHIILVYRQYADWISSLYRYANSRTNLWWDRPRWNQYPTKTKPTVFTFRQYFFKLKDNKNPFRDVFRAFQRKNNTRFLHIHVLDMHHLQSSSSDNSNNTIPGDIGLDVLCHVLKAPTACHAFRAELLTKQQQANTGHYTKDPYLVDVELMVVLAKQLGYLGDMKRPKAYQLFRTMMSQWSQNRHPEIVPWDTRSTWKVRWPPFSPIFNHSALQQQPSNPLTKIPLECLLTEEEKTLRKFGLGNQLILLGKNHFNDDFQKQTLDSLMQRNAFCNIDLNLLFATDPIWMQFLNCLNHTTTVNPNDCLKVEN